MTLKRSHLNKVYTPDDIAAKEMISVTTYNRVEFLSRVSQTAKKRSILANPQSYEALRIVTNAQSE